MLCISTNFLVLRALASWLTFFAVFNHLLILELFSDFSQKNERDKKSVDFVLSKVTNVVYFDQLSGAARTRNASWLTFLCCFQPFVDFRTFSVIFLKTTSWTSWTRNQLILYGARLQMLCISTSFRVLHALESWLTFCFWPYSTIFVDFRSFSVILSQTTTGHKISCFCIEQGDKNNRWKANMILLKKQS